MKADSIRSGVRRVLSAVLKQDLTAMVLVSRSDLPAWDSLKHVQVIFAIEDEFGIEIPDEDAEKITTVQLAIDYAKSHQKA